MSSKPRLPDLEIGCIPKYYCNQFLMDEELIVVVLWVATHTMVLPFFHFPGFSKGKLGMRLIIV